MIFPEDLHYSADHEWLRLEGETATVGITAFAIDHLGDIVFLDIPEVGRDLEPHTVFGTIEAVKTVSDLFSPVGGTLLEVNPKLAANPELVNTDPYGEGWLIKVLVREVPDNLLNVSRYRQLTGAH